MSDLSGAGELLVFADAWTDAPGIESVESGYTPLMFDNGVLDVVDGTASPRSELLTSLRRGAGTEAPPTAPATPTWPLGQIVDLVRR